MLRQVKIALATFAGMAAGGLLILALVLTRSRDYPVDPFTGEQFTALSWTKGIVMFDMPIVGIVLIASLALLELVQPRLKAPRILFFVMGTLAIAMIFGAMFAFAAAQFFSFDPSMFGNAFGFETPQAMIGGLFFVPALIASTAYVWLTKDQAPGSADPVPQEPYAVAVPGPVTPSLEVAPDSERMISIMTSPHERIGQRAFLYAIRLWSTAVAVWMIAPVLLAGFLGLGESGKYLLSGLGWLLLFWSAFCITANRMHDLGLSAVWAGAPVFVAVASVILETPASEPLVSPEKVMQLVLALLIFYSLTAALLLIRKGDPNPNRFGATSI